MIMRINHVGVIVHDLDDMLKIYEKVFGLKLTTVKTAVEGKERVAFVPLGDGEIS